MRLVEIASLFLFVAIALSSVMAAPDSCRGVQQRREIRSLSQQERTTFFNAFRNLQRANQPNTCDWFTRTHLDAARTAHGFPQFLSWHRAFIRSFEKELQRTNPSITLPYWDWSYDSQAPELSSVFLPAWYGGNGQTGDRCVTNGVFSGWRPYYESPHCLRRDWNGGNRLLSFSTPEELDYIARTSTTYDRFRTALEGGPHGMVHTAIGGDMTTMQSPNDPIFYLHHAFIDKLWLDWQARSDNARKYGGTNADGSPAQLTNILRPFNYTVNDVLDTRNLCYTYAPFQPRVRITNISPSQSRVGNSTSSNDVSITPISSGQTSTNGTGAVDPNDRTELVTLRTSRPLPEDWIRLNNLNVQQVRQDEATLRNVVAQTNARPNYVSSAALINNPQALAALAASNQRLTATKANRKIAVQIQNGRLSEDSLQNVATQVSNSLAGSGSSTTNT